MMTTYRYAPPRTPSTLDHVAEERAHVACLQLDARALHVSLASGSLDRWAHSRLSERLDALEWELFMLLGYFGDYTKGH